MKTLRLGIVCDGLENCAPPGNRTRVARMGILHDTTTPAALRASLPINFGGSCLTPARDYAGKIFLVEMSGIEPETFHMQSERSTTELHPRSNDNA